uniref:Toll-like receptor 4 n=1 Tax=Electrophorus electricus TaxID=8005 RepID=A0A4W4G2I5_ELEEL
CVSPILDFSFNFLPSLYKSVLHWLYGLHVLDLTRQMRCHIQYIADDAFHNVKNVTTLILAGNPISHIGPDALNSLHNLHRLHISIIKVNHMTVLHEMRGNITLILSRNSILYIEPGAFRYILLRELNIQGTFVSLNTLRDSLKALSGLNVSKLIIGSYIPAISLKAVDPYYLDSLCLINFTEIYFLQKESSNTEFHVLHCRVNATKITLKEGYLRVIEYVPFHHLKEFYIDLSRNQISLKGCSYYYKDMFNIRYINLSLNANINIDRKPFSGLELLDVLDFHHTRLDVIGQYGDLQNLKYSTYLDLSYTSVTFSCHPSFQGLNSLKVLKIFCHTFQRDILGYLFANLTVLDVLDIIQLNTLQNLPSNLSKIFPHPYNILCYQASKQQSYSYDAFVIYSSKDECWVLDELLCLHMWDFEVGKAIISNIIDEGILGSRKIIVVFQVPQSWLVMQGNPIIIIIIILEDVEEETKNVFGLHKYLKKNTYLKWSQNPLNNMRFWIRLKKAVIASK